MFISCSKSLAAAAVLVSAAGYAQIVEPTPAPISGNNSNPTNIVYFAANGSDSNPCTQAQPCLTQTKLNTLLQPGNITAKFNRGDSFKWENWGCSNKLNVTNSTTPTTNPIPCPNVTIDAYGTGDLPTFEGADILPLTNTNTVSVDGAGTYVYTYTPGQLYAEGIFVDKVKIDSAADGHLLNEPNGPLQQYVAGTTYYPGQPIQLSAVAFRVIGNRGPTSADVGKAYDYTRPTIPAEADVSASGLVNVQNNPGSTYNDTQAGKLYMHLVDGSNPVNHVIQASVRKTSLFCESCNGWLVKNVRFEKYYLGGVHFVNYSSSNTTNQYYTNVNNQVDSIQAWDNTSELKLVYAGQGSSASLHAAQVLFQMTSSSSATTDGAATGWKVTNSTFGRGGSIPNDEDGGNSYGEVFMFGGNAPEIGNNTGVSWMHNGFGIQGATNAWMHDNAAEGQNRGCIFCISNNFGFLVERNHGGGGAGDGMQGGGRSSGTGTWDYDGTGTDVPGTNPMIVRYNMIHDFGIARGALYNCYDFNTDRPVPGILFDHNSAVNCDSAAYTFEVNNNSPAGSGIINVTFRHNIANQHKNYAPYTDRTGVDGIMNNSNVLYFANSTVPGVTGYFRSWDNIYQIGSNNTMAAHVGNCSYFLSLVGDKGSQCILDGTDNTFTDITNGVYTLKKGSPAVNRPVAPQNIGAYGIDYTPVLGPRTYGITRASGQFRKTR